MISKGIEKKINIIWLGGPLPYQHIQRALGWVKLNPSYDITYYVDEEFKEHIEDQLSGLKITIKDISSIKVSSNQLSFIKKLIEPRQDNLLPNYAAASDVYRFAFDGWYADTDITPFNANKKVKANQLNLVIHAMRNDSHLEQLIPDVFAISANNVLSTIVQQCYEFLSIMVNDEHIQLIRSNKASVRKLATELSTGVGLRYALGKLIVNGKSIVEVFNQYEDTTRNEDVFDAIAQKFDSAMEQSYILSSKIKMGYDRYKIVPLEGIEVDPDYLPMTNGIYSEAILQTVRPLSDLMIAIFHKMENKTVAIQDERRSSQLSELQLFGVFSNKNFAPSVTPQIEAQVIQTP